MGGVDTRIVLGIALFGGILGFLVLRRSPKLAFASWLAVLCLVPYWVGVDVVSFAPATSAMAALVVASLVTSRRPRLGAVDILVILIIAIYLVAMLVADATIASGFVLVVHWSFGYLLGRVVTTRLSLDWVYGAIAVALTAAAVLALVEFASGTNVLAMIRVDNAAYRAWSGAQERGGLLRSEGAFGHSIALGACLAMAIPLTIASPFRAWIRSGMALLLLGGTIVTFSRTAMICAALSVILTVVFLKGTLSARTRAVLVLGTVVVAAVVGPFILSTFSEAGDEATGSSSYRGDLLSLVPTMSIIGLSSSSYRSASGEVYYGGFQSIDSALIFLGLTHGLITLALVLALLAVCIWFVASGRATAPTIAVVAQIPALATVALITQYAIFFWVMCGLAVSAQILRHRGVPSNRAPSASAPHPLANDPVLATPIHSRRGLGTDVFRRSSTRGASTQVVGANRRIVRALDT